MDVLIVLLKAVIGSVSETIVPSIIDASGYQVFSMSIRSLVLIILCASLLAVGSAMGKAMPGPYPGYLIHVEKQDGTNFDARLKDEVRIETEYGTETFPLTHLIRRITFKPDQPSRRPMHGRSAAIIELKDKTILRGRIPGEEWTFAVNDKDQKIPFAELRT